MSHHVPFNQETYRPKSIRGNATADRPVEFDLSQVGGADLVRLKALMYALGAIAYVEQWTPDVQQNSVESFRNGPEVFVNGIDAIRNYYVPAALAKKAGVLLELPLGEDGKTPDGKKLVAIVDGAQFAKISGFQTVLALEVAMRIATISNEGDVDPRFFDSSITSRGMPTPAGDSGRSGIARSARRKRGARATAGSRPRTGR